MAIYIITCDFEKEKQNRNKIINYFNNYPNFNDDSYYWFIETGKSAQKIIRDLRPLINNNSVLFVSELEENWIAIKNQNLSDWLKHRNEVASEYREGNSWRFIS